MNGGGASEGERAERGVQAAAVDGSEGEQGVWREIGTARIWLTWRKYPDRMGISGRTLVTFRIAHDTIDSPVSRVKSETVTNREDESIAPQLGVKALKIESQGLDTACYDSKLRCLSIFFCVLRIIMTQK